MTRAEAVAFLVKQARGADGTWPYWTLEEARPVERVQRFSGIVDPDDPVSLLWAYRAASARLKPTGPDRKAWLRLIEAYELLVTP